MDVPFAISTNLYLAMSMKSRGGTSTMQHMCMLSSWKAPKGPGHLITSLKLHRCN